MEVTNTAESKTTISSIQNELNPQINNPQINSHTFSNPNNNEKNHLSRRFKFFKYLNPQEKIRYIAYCGISIALLFVILIFTIHGATTGAQGVELVISIVIIPIMIPLYGAMKIRLNGVRRMNEKENTLESLQELQKEEKGLENLHASIFTGNKFPLIMDAVVFLTLIALVLFVWFVMGLGRY